MNLAPLRIPCASFVRELPHGTPIIRTRPRLLRGLFPRHSTRHSLSLIFQFLLHPL